MKQHTNYHRALRVSVVVCALALVFQSGLLSDSTAELSKGTQSYLANAIGMSASVKPTELNMLTAELTERERDLEVREAALAEREITVDVSTGSQDDSEAATYILASILFIMLVLILLNYILDYLRAREEQTLETV